MAVISVAAVAILMASRQHSSQGIDAAVDAPPDNNTAAAWRLQTKKTGAARVTAATVAGRTRATNSTIVNRPADESLLNSGVESGAQVPSAETTLDDGHPAEPVTITGCLEQDDEAFRLKDTAGLDAPKSRSWRSGFLKRRSTSVELVDAAHALRLTSYVGQRVAATGMLANREMRVHTLQRVAPSCG